MPEVDDRQTLGEFLTSVSLVVLVLVAVFAVV